MPIMATIDSVVTSKKHQHLKEATTSYILSNFKPSLKHQNRGVLKLSLFISYSVKKSYKAAINNRYN